MGGDVQQIQAHVLAFKLYYFWGGRGLTQNAYKGLQEKENIQVSRKQIKVLEFKCFQGFLGAIAPLYLVQQINWIIIQKVS